MLSYDGFGKPFKHLKLKDGKDTIIRVWALIALLSLQDRIV